MVSETPLLAGLAFVGALIVGITGFGSALVTIPIAVQFVPLQFALPLFALVDLSTAFSVGLENPRNAARNEWWRLVPMILFGTALGVTLLVNLPRAAGMFLLGAFVFSYALYSLVRHGPARVVAGGWGWVAGLCGGITSTLFGAGGPPYAIYLSHRGLTKEQFRATMGFCTMTSISVRVIAFFITGLLLNKQVWLTALVAVPAALLGMWVARHAYLHISREMLMRVVAVILLASGGSLVVRSLG
ncbi:MAG: sulfite exporter TauE/SafE family protein [Betaproteobacteria bacterium]|nr:sulfite exporter TauE/SafE family protein [Betaproteobacteria bacterium]MBV9361778.1 sulfite exporter TauE/SafE family protein [Betaproteobacteria bacterium]